MSLLKWETNSVFICFCVLYEAGEPLERIPRQRATMLSVRVLLLALARPLVADAFPRARLTLLRPNKTCLTFARNIAALHVVKLPVRFPATFSQGFHNPSNGLARAV